jgi:quercetin dioxygenase-like cupin family protein
MLTRRDVLAATSGAALASAGPAFAQDKRIGNMKITRSGSQPFRKGPAEYFTGSVRIEQPFQGTAPARIGGAFVTFEPGARTAWHTHPLGQTLIVTAGHGWVQTEGGPK